MRQMHSSISRNVFQPYPWILLKTLCSVMLKTTLIAINTMANEAPTELKMTRVER